MLCHEIHSRSLELVNYTVLLLSRTVGPASQRFSVTAGEGGALKMFDEWL